MIKKATFFLVLLMSSSLFSQQINLDKYQYIIVSNKFDFVKDTDHPYVEEKPFDWIRGYQVGGKEGLD